MMRTPADDLAYLLECVDAHTDKFPVPEHMRSVVARIRRSREPVAWAGTMPGTDGFTMAVFRAENVPIGTALYLHPAPTRDDVLEEAAKVSDEQAKQDRAARLAKAKTNTDECAYHLWAEQTAEEIATKLRSLKGGKSSDPFAEAAWMLRQRGALEFADALDKEVAVLRATIERLTKERDEGATVIAQLNGGAELQNLMRINNDLLALADSLTAELAKVREAAQKQGVIDGNQITSLAAELANAREALTKIAREPLFNELFRNENRIMDRDSMIHCARAALPSPQPTKEN